MKKILKDIRLYEYGESSLNGATLKEALQQIKDWIVFYGENAKIDIGQEYEDYSSYQYVYLHIRGSREETDDEYASRIGEEQALTNIRVQREKAEFERLSKIYGDNK